MKLHANARTCPKSRRLIVKRIEEEGWSLAAAAEAAGVSERTAAKWLARWRAEGEAGLLDRSSAPKPPPDAAARRSRGGDRGAAAAADDRRRDRRVPGHGALDGLAVAAADRPRQALAPRAARAAQPLRAKAPGRAGPRRRQEARADPQRRVTGSPATARDRVTRRDAATASPAGSSVHVCVDDATRLAYVEVLADEKGETAAGFLRRAVEWFASMGITVERVMSDNGSCYRSQRPRRRPAASSGSATCAPGPTGRAPTARPSASSRRFRTAGPTAPSTAPRPSAPRPYPAGSPTTTSPDDMAPSATSRPQLGSPSWNNVMSSYS